MIPLFKVFMPESVIEPVKEVLLSGYIGQGTKVDEFEEKLSDWFKYKSVVTINNATAGLHLALRMAGVKHGDEVLSTPLTCTATNWPILANGGKIKWVDVDPGTCNIDLDDLEAKISEKTKAVIVVHWGGYPVDIDRLNKIAGRFGVPVIEDCAHSFGSSYKGDKIGSSGNYCVFSFQAIKHLTTVDGGCINLPHKEYERAKLLRWYGIDRSSPDTAKRAEGNIEEWGYKFHMNDLNASIGIEQMKYVDENIRIHKENAKYYDKALSGVDGVTLMERHEGRESAFWMYTMKVDRRDGFSKRLSEKGIHTNRVHERNDKHSCVADSKTELPRLDGLVKTMVNIPVGWWVTKEQRELIADCIKEGW